MKERILITNPIKQNPTRIDSASPEQQLEKPKDYARRIAKIFRQECINIITKYSVPTMIMRFTIPAMIHNVQFERKIEISQDDGDAELKTLGTATQDIGGLQQQIDVINEELNRQTHFRGYYLLNTDTQQLENSANRDFAFSAESGTVWMYDQSWYNSGDIVPDQVTPASDANPLVDSRTGVTGTSTQYSRGDHQHPLQVSTVLPSKDTSVSTIGSASSYARSEHQHPIQSVNTIPVSDLADGSYGTVESYARNDHSHPINVQTNASIVPIVNGVINKGLTIGLSNESGAANRGLRISADGNTLSFNGSVIAGVGATNGATNGSVQYSAGNLILWGVNSTGTEGGFYSNGTNICWRARPVTLGSVPP
ncbi:MAG: hypothetical protein EZS28_022714 [Streblomastix strix]|uniref:Uncharacterized protein n=1 Tax=Streblomastix strix TaxID=222440 RepID=A0A5J4VGN0_9EUKA|nr:MAG: hypothetical protein EZS28_022714 [Streblomastix strix]